MIRWSRSSASGYTIVELMISLVIIGIIAAVGLPIYNGYITTANMVTVNSNYEKAIRQVLSIDAINRANVATGNVSTSPTSTSEWVDLLNASGYEAPGGGPAYVASSNKAADRGDSNTGAIGVKYTKGTVERVGNDGNVEKIQADKVQLWRPWYLYLSEQRADIVNGELTNTKLKEARQ